MRASCLTNEPRGDGEARTTRLYDRLERALIALEYALADARASEQETTAPQYDRIARSQEAMQSAGEEVQEVLVALKTVALEHAAQRARQWS
jgi:hypothetical protein